MKLSLSLLDSLIPIDRPVEEVADTLTLLGIEVDAIHSPKPPFSGVVVAEVRSVMPHPEAKKLQVAQVFDGTTVYQIVCGAANCRAGIKVAFAQVGASLGSPARIIEKASLRGVSSHGMLCSAAELGIYDQDEGILELPTEFKTGADCMPLLWDPVLELSFTPNLGHSMSALGVARELSAAWQVPLRKSKIPILEATSERSLKVSVENKELCPRYAARVIANVHVGPSPFWLQKHLLTAGLRPINNIVDVTNYMLLKTGQPMHAFDSDLIVGKTIRVAATTKSENFLGLNGASIEIPVGTLCIWDQEKPIALAGILGGANSAVSNATKNIVLEAAVFDPFSIRKSAKKMGLRTDSSLRFEKGIDPSAVGNFIDEAAALIQELSKGVAASSRLDVGQIHWTPLSLTLRPARVVQVLGVKLSEGEIVSILQRLHMNANRSSERALQVEIPTYRTDISEEIDLVEEVARIYGYNHIERHTPRVTTSSLPHDPEYLFEKELRTRLVALGLQEFLTCDLISPKLALVAQELSHKKTVLLETKHSKSEEYSILRPSLLPNLLQVARLNFDQKNHSLNAFELGRIHFMQEGAPVEIPMVAILCSGKKTPPHWGQKGEEVDFFDLKGLVENWLETLRVRGALFTASNHPTFHPHRQANVSIGDLAFGSLGEVHPRVLSALGIDTKVYYAEFNAEHLRPFAASVSKMIPLSQFPSSERDWTVPLEPKAPVSFLLEAIEALKSSLLEQVSIIDLYATEEKRNVTLRFVYRDRMKTVSFEEVEAAHTHLVQAVSRKLSSCKN
ncbi:MAG TPA: phenylalanine--tRNA ligase subunit beta [Chlamydiales bacterium]